MDRTEMPIMPLSLGYQGSAPGSSGRDRDPQQRRFRIAFLAPEDRRTGTYFRSHNLAIALRQLGHKVTVYSQSSNLRIRGAREYRDGIPYVMSPTVPGNRWILPPTNPLNFLRRIFTPVEPADIYHLFQPYPTAAWLWLWLRRRRRSTFFYDWDDFWINEEFGLKEPEGLAARWAARCVGRLERLLPARTDGVTAVSQALANLALKWGAPASTVIHNGVWPQQQKDQEAARAELDLPQQGFYVGLMGWSGEIEWCLEAIRRYREDFPSLRLLITGRDPKEKLDGYPDLADRIHYLGSLPEEKFSYFNSAIDLGLVPMRDSEFNHYRLPYKLTDHLAGGVPVLCSRIGEAANLAGELEGLHLCEPNLHDWLAAFRQSVRAIIGGEIPARVPTDSLHRNLSWLVIARQTEMAYRQATSVIPERERLAR